MSDWPAIDPGELRHQVQIQQQSSTQDAAGQPVATWATIRTTWSGLNLVSMREAFGEGQLTAQESDIWTIRWSAGITPGMRLVFGANVYKIQAVNDPGRRTWVIHLLCLQLNAQS